MDYSRFLNIYANVPDKLRNGIIAVVDDKPYSWNASYIEIAGNTELGQKIYNQLIKTEII
ncbi:hypothetical protein IJI17_02480 [Candidatus Saccharibacteria bacterium]|nr:hypothetical protein [Candidatus Saccharibacteria bacterium]MBQ6321062.1 hypothetical protein [Candidatus Saccharibacteria bacterium]